MTGKFKHAANRYFSRPSPHEKAWADFRRMYPGKPIMGDATGKPFIKFTQYELSNKDSQNNK